MARRIRRDSSIPTEVLERLTTEQRSAVMTETDSATIETRGFNGVETRDNGDGSWELRGYAAVYDVGYPIAGGPDAGGWTEIISRNVANKSLSDGADCKMLFDHTGIPLASTRAGTLQVTSDEMGLRFVAPNLDSASPYAASVRSAVLRGDATTASWAFRVVNQKWNSDYTVRTITEAAIYDVSVVSYPANPATVVTMHSAKPDGLELRRSDLLELARKIEARVNEADEAIEDATVEQVEKLIAMLIQGEAQEIIDGGEATQSLCALVSILEALNWFEYVDTLEDAETDDVGAEPMMEQTSAVLSVELARRQAEAARVRQFA